MPGTPPARPTPPRSLAEERPRGPPRLARGALPTGTRGSPASSRPRTCRPPPSAPPPRASRSPGACGRRAARVSPPPAPAGGLARPESARPSSHSRPVSSSPRPLAAPRGPKSHPCRGFPLGPCASWKSRGGSGTREGTRSPTREKERWGRRGSGKRSAAFGVLRTLSGNSG